MIREWDLTETNLHRLQQRKYEVAVLATCAVESHNLHLPEGTDFFESTYVSRKCCELAWPRCESVICLPALPFGVDCNLSDFPLSVHVSQNTLNQMIREIITSLRGFGIRKFVIVNSHGGNDFTAFVRQIQSDLDIHLFICNWWTVGSDKYADIFENRDDHAGEMETSVMMHLLPQLVELEKAKDGAAKPFRFEALRKGWLKTSRNFGKLNDHSAVGDPRKATPAKGEKYLALVTKRIADFLVDLANTPIDESFPHK
jgi:creatinine amidohydrolase